MKQKNIYLEIARIANRAFLYFSHILICRRMEYKTFSCFENFVPCVNCGAPEHTPNHFALLHLEKLLQSVSEKVRGMGEAELSTAAAVSKAALIQTEPEVKVNSFIYLFFLCVLLGYESAEKCNKQLFKYVTRYNCFGRRVSNSFEEINFLRFVFAFHICINNASILH